MMLRGGDFGEMSLPQTNKKAVQGRKKGGVNQDPAPGWLRSNERPKNSWKPDDEVIGSVQRRPRNVSEEASD